MFVSTPSIWNSPSARSDRFTVAPKSGDGDEAMTLPSSESKLGFVA